MAHIVSARILPPAVLQGVTRKTDSVPLFVEELTKTVLASGLLEEQAGHYALHGPLPSLAIPTTLYDALLARLDRLATAKVVAQLGATIGRTFTYDLLQAVASLDAASLDAALAQLVEAEIVTQRGLPSQATYTFKHALIQDAAYESLLRSTRQHYHQRIAQVLAERFPDSAEAQPEVLAQHYIAAGLHAQALFYWQRAGQRALARSAHPEAVASWERGLEALTHLPQHRSTLEQAIDLRFALRSALLASRDMRRIAEHLHEAEALAASLNDVSRLGQIVIFQAVDSYYDGTYAQASAACQRALELARDSEDVGLEAVANLYLANTFHLQGAYCEAIACFRQAVALLEKAPRYAHFGLFLPAVLSRAFLAWAYVEMGQFTEGSTVGEGALQIAEDAANPASLMLALWGLGLCALRQGDLPRVLLHLEHAMGICQEALLPNFSPRVAATLSEVHTHSGRLSEALSLMTQAMAQPAALARELVSFQALYHLSMGAVQLQAGYHVEAQTLAEQVLTLAITHQERGNQAYALAEELGMRPLQAHCHHGLGTLYRQTGRAALAYTALSTAIALYRTMDMTLWLPTAEATLAQVETS